MISEGVGALGNTGSWCCCMNSMCRIHFSFPAGWRVAESWVWWGLVFFNCIASPRLYFHILSCAKDVRVTFFFLSCFLFQHFSASKYTTEQYYRQSWAPGNGKSELTQCSRLGLRHGNRNEVCYFTTKVAEARSISPHFWPLVWPETKRGIPEQQKESVCDKSSGSLPFILW